MLSALLRCCARVYTFLLRTLHLLRYAILCARAVERASVTPGFVSPSPSSVPTPYILREARAMPPLENNSSSTCRRRCDRAHLPPPFYLPRDHIHYKRTRLHILPLPFLWHIRGSLGFTRTSSGHVPGSPSMRIRTSPLLPQRILVARSIAFAPAFWRSRGSKLRIRRTS